MIRSGSRRGRAWRSMSAWKRSSGDWMAGNRAFGAPRPRSSPSRPARASAANRPFIARFDAGGSTPPALAWRPSTEAVVDTRNPPPTHPARRQPAAPAGACGRRARRQPRARRPAAGPRPARADASPTRRNRPLRDAELWLLARRTQGAALRVDFELRTAVRAPGVPPRLRLRLAAAARARGQPARAGPAIARASTTRSPPCSAARKTCRSCLDRIQADLAVAIAARPRPGAQVAFAAPARFQATVVCPFAASLSRAADARRRRRWPDLEMALAAGRWWSPATPHGAGQRVPARAARLTRICACDGARRVRAGREVRRAQRAATGQEGGGCSRAPRRQVHGVRACGVAPAARSAPGASGLRADVLSPRTPSPRPATPRRRAGPAARCARRRPRARRAPA